MLTHFSSKTLRAIGAPLVFASTLLLTACGSDPPTLEIAPDSARTGALGELGPYGVLAYPRTFRVRVDEAAEAEIIVPTLDGKEPAAGPFPPIVLIPGGLVAVARYRWLGAHIASRGFTVIAPDSVLPILLERGNVMDAFESVRAASQREADPLYGVITTDAPALARGHSLGGVVAAKLWNDHPKDITHIALICSSTDPADDYSARPLTGNERIVSVLGSKDTRQPEGSARDGLKTFKAPVTFGTVDGMNHYQVVEDPTESELASDGPASIDEKQARFLTTFLLDALLNDFIGKEEPALDSPATWPAGLVPLSR